MGKTDFRKIPNGTNGIEDRLSILWDHGVERGYLSQSEFVEVTSTNAAKFFNLFPKKGIIQKGSDADVVVWTDNERLISAKTHHHNLEYSVFEGMKVKGARDITICNGEIVFDGDKYNEKQGRGKYLIREPFGYAFDRINKLDKWNDPVKLKVNRD